MCGFLPQVVRLAMVTGIAAMFPVACAAGESSAAHGQDAGLARHWFDMPAQPLPKAIQAYSQQTRRSVLYETAQAESKTSAPVHGWHTADDALTALLHGAGLAMRHTSARAILLQPLPAQGDRPSADMDAVGATPASHVQYLATMRRLILAALCREAGLETGGYRLALRVWAEGPNGALRVTSHATGRRALEPSIEAALAQLQVGLPPAGFTQPTVLLLTPQSARHAGACAP